VEARVSVEATVQAGLCFRTFRHPEKVNTNLPRHDATDLMAGTAEFKAAAVRVERIAGVETPERREVAVS